MACLLLTLLAPLTGAADVEGVQIRALTGTGAAIFSLFYPCEDVEIKLIIFEAPGQVHWGVLNLWGGSGCADASYGTYYAAFPLHVAMGTLYELDGDWDQGFQGKGTFASRISIGPFGEDVTAFGCVSCVGSDLPFGWQGTLHPVPI